MWILNSKRALWHCYESDRPGVGLCGASLANPGEEREQEGRPVGFDGLLCNRCWFRLELDQTLAFVSDPSTREWLADLNYSRLAESETERLCAELGETRALSLIVIHGLAAGSEVERPVAPIPEPALTASGESDLSVIPLAVQSFAPIEAPDSGSEECAAESAKPSEPRMKINCSRTPTPKTGSRGITRFFRR